MCVNYRTERLIELFHSEWPSSNGSRPIRGFNEFNKNIFLKALIQSICLTDSVMTIIWLVKLNAVSRKHRRMMSSAAKFIAIAKFMASVNKAIVFDFIAHLTLFSSIAF